MMRDCFARGLNGDWLRGGGQFCQRGRVFCRPASVMKAGRGLDRYRLNFGAHEPEQAIARRACGVDQHAFGRLGGSGGILAGPGVWIGDPCRLSLVFCQRMAKDDLDQPAIKGRAWQEDRRHGVFLHLDGLGERADGAAGVDQRREIAALWALAGNASESEARASGGG